MYIWGETAMTKVSATNFRKHLFDYLDRVAGGEIIVIQRNNQEVARLIPVVQSDWRENMKITPELLVSPEEFIKPLDDIWEEYV
ncbi:MAG: type II toxin-antitoxin system Phd/YefM family antitoxin [Chloroflexi bacterium]|nr:type II toxin-antitoxin system Phd/YefM family antitoxin [Chloroflexota bacterium]